MILGRERPEENIMRYWRTSQKDIRNRQKPSMQQQMSTDALISPADTVKCISMGIEAANRSPVTEKFKVGVIQI